MFKSLTFKIWFPFSIITLTLFLFMSIYYPQKQKKIIFEQKKRELKELAQNIAISVEYSLSSQNFSNLKKSVDYIKGSSDFGFVAIYNKEQDSTINLFRIIPDEALAYLNEKNEDNFLLAKSDFKSPVMSGYVLIAFKRKIIEETIQDLNTPLYYMIGISYLITCILFFSIAKNISKPVLKVAEQTNRMESGNYSVETKIETSSNELNTLSKGIELLRKSLLKAEKNNQELLNSLEEKVKNRTIELDLAVSTLNEAQKIAKFGSYLLDIQSNTWSSSTSLDEIFGIDAEFTRNLDNFISIITEKHRFKLIKSFEEALLHGKEMRLEYEIINQRSKKTIKVRGYGKVEYDKEGRPDKISGVIQDISTEE